MLRAALVRNRFGDANQMANADINFDRDSRLRYADIDATTGKVLRDAWIWIKPELPRILEAFYAKVSAEPALSKIIAGQQSRLKQAQTTHWERLIGGGTFDAAYMDSVYKIGMAHKRIGLEPRWYMAGYKYILNEIVTLAVGKYWWSPSKLRSVVRALNSAVMLDIDLAISAYQDAIE